jgi:hypothetical protein
MAIVMILLCGIVALPFWWGWCQRTALSAPAFESFRNWIQSLGLFSFPATLWFSVPGIIVIAAPAILAAGITGMLCGEGNFLSRLADGASLAFLVASGFAFVVAGLAVVCTIAAALAALISLFAPTPA